MRECDDFRMPPPQPEPADVQWAAGLLQAPVVEWGVVYARNGRSTKRLLIGSRVVYLKSAAGLAAESDRLRWLESVRPAPEVLGFRAGEPDWLLTAAAVGADLTSDRYTGQPEVVVTLLAEALRGLHGLDPTTCPFGRPGPGLVVVHGDACLPNFLAVDGRISSYLDVGELRVDRPDVDLAAAVWSLHHNLGPGWGAAFLEAYGWPDRDEVAVERLRLDYKGE